MSVTWFTIRNDQNRQSKMLCPPTPTFFYLELFRQMVEMWITHKHDNINRNGLYISHLFNLFNKSFKQIYNTKRVQSKMAIKMVA